VVALVDWKKPDFDAIFERRYKSLQNIRNDPELLPILRAHYRDNPADFISDWGVTYEPRNVEVGLPTLLPFVLFEKQREFIDYVLRKWRERRPGLVEKSRDVGISWTSIGLACSLCIFNDGMSIGFGSRKAEYVDKLGEMKSLLPKARVFMQNLPEEFRAGWIEWRDAPQMRISFPQTGSVIGGEGGDDIGRGDRRAIYFVDEFAHFQHADLVEASLSQTTNCRIDMSSVRGMNNPFARKRWGGKIEVFIFDWRDDPRKDDTWYAEQVATYDPVVVAKEIDRDYSASVHGIVIPGAWVRAAIGAWQALELPPPSGEFSLALDVADEGIDKNAFVGGKGVDVSVCEEWSGRGSDTFATVERAFELADGYGVTRWRYDADGMGALVRGDARALNERRTAAKLPAHRVVGFRGSEAVVDPEGIVEGTIGREGDRGRTNQDYFLNRKAQGWWSLRRRFQRVYRWRNEGVPCRPDDIISLDPKMPNLMKLVAELSQPTYKQNAIGKMLVDKKPDGMPSPNLADGLMMRFAELEPQPIAELFTPQVLRKIRQQPMPRRARIRL
jgi:phage terminase large subunit